MGIDTAQPALMPDFSQPERGFRHTVDSALEVLWGLGVSASRITLNMIGAGWPSHWVVGQTPAHGTSLGPDVSVSLSVAGLGFFHSLPVGFWDEGGETEMGTKEIMGVVNDPIQKQRHWIREGARLFDIQAGNYAACERWIRLFGLNPEHWPPERWYGLALLLPALHRLAGREEGIRFAFKVVFDLPVAEIRRKPSFRRLVNDELTLLGGKASRLGRDAILGNRVEDLAYLTVVIGAVPLKTYNQFHGELERKQLSELLTLCAPLHQRYEVDWLVLDRQRSPRLGFEGGNSRLGVNAYLGDAREWARAPALAGVADH